MTACLKNKIRIKGRKDFLPHYRKGSVYNGGDEYFFYIIFKYILIKLDEIANLFHYYNHLDHIYFFTSFLRRFLLLIIIRFKKHPYLYENWIGNYTLCRAILDLNRILFILVKMERWKDGKE